MKKLLAFIAITAMTLTAQAVTVTLNQSNDTWDNFTTGPISSDDTLDVDSIQKNGGTLLMMIKVNSLPTGPTSFLTGHTGTHRPVFDIAHDGDMLYTDRTGGSWLLTSSEYIKGGDTFAFALEFHKDGKFDIYINGKLKASNKSTANLGSTLTFHTDGGNFEYEFVGTSSNLQGSTTSVPEPTAMALLLMGVAAVGLRRKAKQVA